MSVIVGTHTGTPVSRLDIDNEVSRFYNITGVPSHRVSEFASIVFQRAQQAHLFAGDARLTGILTEMRAVASQYGLTQNPDAAHLAAYQRANVHDSVSAVFEHGNNLYRGGLPGLAALAAANSSRGYSALREAGGALGSHGDIGRISMTNYVGSPFAATGMNFATFSSLRADGFQATHILHAGQDTRRHGFSPNGPMARSFAVLDREDGARRAERNQHLERLRRIAEQDEQLKKLKREYETARTPEDRARILSQIDARGRELQGGSGYAGFAAQAPTEAGKREGARVGAAVVRRAALGFELSPEGQRVGAPADISARLTPSERHELDNVAAAAAARVEARQDAPTSLRGTVVDAPPALNQVVDAPVPTSGNARARFAARAAETDTPADQTARPQPTAVPAPRPA